MLVPETRGGNTCTSDGPRLRAAGADAQTASPCLSLPSRLMGKGLSRASVKTRLTQDARRVPEMLTVTATMPNKTQLLGGPGLCHKHHQEAAPLCLVLQTSFYCTSGVLRFLQMEGRTAESRGHNSCALGVQNTPMTHRAVTAA